MIIRFLAGCFFLGWAQVAFYVEPIRYFGLDGNPYVELFLGVDGTSVRYIPAQDEYHAKVDFSLVLRNSAEEPVYADKFSFILPSVRDTNLPSRQRIYADVRRLRLPKGIYTLEIEGRDPHQLPKSQVVKAITQFEISEPKRGFAYSDLLYATLLTPAKGEGYERHNLHIQPLISNGILIDPDSLIVYGEILHVDSLTTEPYYLRLRVLDAQQAQEITSLSLVKRPRRPSAFEAFFFTLPLRGLPSGIYLTQVELCRNDGELLASWYRRFVLYNTRESLPDATEEEYDTQFGFPENKLDELLSAMSYLATPTERSFLHGLGSFSEKKKFFMAFWKKRATMPNGITAKEFLRRFEYAQQHFKSTLRPGWRTDRGRVFIQYGPPNDMQFFYNEPDKYPYQIWTYNQIGSQTQVIFVFYDPDLITGEYPLLHSNKIGELQNRNWRAFLLRARASA
ncbi:MAG: GWxTD domain-containing protein, partial [Bacteroidia bacterium]|nr:GWxTD domain-containing protein [Bacteroidia bacterium]MDW8134946.1 GWxTD domain-containing protein [Bacteroidia bacterium]